MVLIMVGLGSAQYNKIRLLDNYVCNGSSMSISISLNSVNFSKFTVGFWIKVPSASPVDQPFFGIDCSAYGSVLPYSIRTNSLPDFEVFQGATLCFQFTGGSSLLDSDFDHLLRIVDNNWHYFIFTFQKVGVTSEIIVTLDNQTGYLVTLATIFTTLNTKLIIGGGVVGMPCVLPYKIHKVDLFDVAYNIRYGANLIQTQLHSFAGGPIRVLYIQNQYLFAFYLVNALNPLAHMAKVTETRINKGELNFPKNIMMKPYFKFEKRELKVQYPSSVIPSSPTDNSYVFVSFFTIYGTNYYTWKCASPGSCSTVILSFLPYLRSPAMNSAFINVGIEDIVTLSTKRQLLNIIIDNTSFPYKNIAYREPDVNTLMCVGNYCFHSLNVKNNILMDHPSVKTCYGEKNLYSCSSEYVVTSTFLSDDIHTTFVTQNTDEYYFVVKFMETFFIDTSDLAYSSNMITNGNNLNIDYVSNLVGWEMTRVTSNSYLSIKTNLSTTKNTNCSISNCDYCESGICYYCWRQYSLVNGVCTYCGATLVFDPISKKCFAQTGTITDIIAFLPQLNTLSASSIVVINILFEVQSVLPPTTSSTYTYALYFNSLDSTHYNPIIRTYYTSAEINDELLHLQVIFNKYLNEMNFFYYKTGLRINYASVPAATYTIPPLTIYPERDACYSDQLQYQAINSYSGRFVPICTSDMFFDSASSSCLACTIGCGTCISPNICTSCINNYQLNEGVCVSQLPPPTTNSTTTTNTTNTTTTTNTSNTTNASNTTNTNNQTNATDQTNASNTTNTSYPIIVPEIVANTSNTSQSASSNNNSVSQSSSSFSVEQIKIENSINLQEIEIICSPGTFWKNSFCLNCQKGCIQCPNLQTCLKCDSNYQLISNNTCTKTSEVVEIQNQTASDSTSGVEQCEGCFQSRSTLSEKCETCTSECPCEMRESPRNNYFTFSCQNTTINSEYFEDVNSNPNFYQTKAVGDFSLTITPKTKKEVISYTVDPMMIRNTTSCFFAPSRIYNITPTMNSWSSNITNLSEGFVANANWVYEYIVPLFSIISQPIASAVVSFIQFNKIYSYISLSDIRVGGIYEYINFNLHEENVSEDGVLLWPEEKYAYLSHAKNMQSNKLCTKSMLLTFLGAHLLAMTGIFIGKLFIYLQISDGFVNVGRFIRYCSYKIDKTILMKYSVIFIVSLNLFIKNLTLIHPPLFLILWISVLIFLTHASIKLFAKAFNFLRNYNPENEFLFYHLKSPDMFKVNRLMLKVWLSDNASFALLAFIIFHFRKYQYFIICFSTILIIMKSSLIARYLLKISRPLLVLRLCSDASLLAFFFLTFLKISGVNIDVVLFDVTYFVSNGLKISELIFESVFVYLSNRSYERQLTQVANIQLEASDS
jgi:hypothetical protein